MTTFFRKRALTAYRTGTIGTIDTESWETLRARYSPHEESSDDKPVWEIRFDHHHGLTTIAMAPTDS